MINPCVYSDVTKRYFSHFSEILDDMIQKMTHIEWTDSISHDFMKQMIPHHRAAIEMSRNVLLYTTFIPVQKIASNIIEEQTKSIESMEAILMTCGACKNTEREQALYQKCFHQITQIMFAGMNRACADNNVNANFMREMIPHHRGAIQMSKNVQRFPICQELKPILTKIITSQQAGIRDMERLLRCV